MHLLIPFASALSDAMKRAATGSQAQGSAALEQLKQEVRKAPRDPRLRVFLFQLFCVFGEWDRAVTQLTVAAQLDPLTVPMPLSLPP